MGVSEVPPEDARTIEATETSFRIIRELKRRDGAGVTELAEALDLPKSTVHKHLMTLYSINHLVKEDGVYRLSLGFLGLGLAARSQFRIADIVQDPLDQLANTAGGTASLVLLEHEHCFHVVRAAPPSAEPLPFHEGERLPAYATAGGKAILAYLPPEERDRILDRIELRKLTDQTITDRTALDEELQSVYDRRHAYDRGEFITDIQCIAAPITDEDQDAVGAVMVTLSTDEGTSDANHSDVATFLGSTVHSIETKL